MKPIVGQTVHFHNSRHEPPQAAIVTSVFSETCVNLAVFRADGSPMESPPMSIRFLATGEEPPTGGCYCCRLTREESPVAEAARRGFYGTADRSGLTR